MTLEQLEVQIVDFTTKAKKLQTKVMQYQRQGAIVARQGEVALRESVNKFFDDGLTFLGKSIVEGRKIKESFVAETHRKTAKLEREEANLNATKERASFGRNKADPNFVKATKSLKPQKPFSDGNSMRKVKAKTIKTENSFAAHSRVK